MSISALKFPKVIALVASLALAGGGAGLYRHSNTPSNITLKATPQDIFQRSQLPAGDHLAKIAKLILAGKTEAKGGCLGSVRKILDLFAQERYNLNTIFPGRSESAYQAVDRFRDPNGAGQFFKEIMGVTRADLAKLPAGCIVIRGRTPEGTILPPGIPQKPHGHIYITLGANEQGEPQEGSDFIGTLGITDYGNYGEVWVFQLRDAAPVTIASLQQPK